MANILMKRDSTWFVIGEMQIKTKSYHYTPIRMAKSGTLTANAGEDMEQQTPLHCCWEYKVVQSLWKTIFQFLAKLETLLPYDPAITLVWFLRSWKYVHTKICIGMIIAALFVIAKNCHQLNVLNREMYKQTLVHWYYGILFRKRNKWTHAQYGWILNVHC